MLKKLKLPKVQMSLALIAIYLSAFGQLPPEQYIYVLIISLASTMLSDLVISYIRIRRLFMPHAAMVTGMILTLLVDPTLAWYKIAAIAFIAMAIKNFVRVDNKHIFNPAASGLLIGGLIFGSYVSWWGSSFQYSSNFNVQTLTLYIVLLSPLYVSAYRIRRYFSILSFIITYAVLAIITFGISLNTLPITLLNPTIIFFSIVMLPEPLTSPSERNKQFIFGAIVAILNFILASNIIAGNIFIPDALIASLLAANLIFFKR
ncbi:MAG: RnfABCDGE type electron transport complex subunit D [Candidatus Levybacteria bacterium]|nr:RnfABCDGE type electron transport complex subunit D [Candidatus Levybacteria bacterium]